MEKSRPIRNWNAFENLLRLQKTFVRKNRTTMLIYSNASYDARWGGVWQRSQTGNWTGPPGWEPEILPTRPSGRWWNWKEGNLMNTCFRMKWEAMWWSFWRISIASAESFFMRVQYTRNANVIEIPQKLHHIASHFIRNHVFIKLPSFQFHHLPDGLVVRIPGSHPGGPVQFPVWELCQTPPHRAS